MATRTMSLGAAVAPPRPRPSRLGHTVLLSVALLWPLQGIAWVDAVPPAAAVAGSGRGAAAPAQQPAEAHEQWALLAAGNRDYENYRCARPSPSVAAPFLRLLPPPAPPRPHERRARTH